MTTKPKRKRKIQLNLRVTRSERAAIMRGAPAREWGRWAREVLIEAAKGARP